MCCALLWVGQRPDLQTTVIVLAAALKEASGFMRQMLHARFELRFKCHRYPTLPVAELQRHQAPVNAVAWAPHSSCHICSAGDDAQALIWDLSSMSHPLDQSLGAVLPLETVQAVDCQHATLVLPLDPGLLQCLNLLVAFSTGVAGI